MSLIGCIGGRQGWLLSKLFDNDHIVGAVKKCYWIFALVVMTGGMLFSVHALTKTYLSYPVSVSVSVQREKQLVFPAVTVCNMSPVKKSALEAADLSGASKRRKKRAAAGSYTFSYTWKILKRIDKRNIIGLTRQNRIYISYCVCMLFCHYIVALSRSRFSSPSSKDVVPRSLDCGPSDVISRCHGCPSKGCPVCLPRYWPMGVVGWDLSTAFKKTLTFVRKMSNFGGEWWLANFFPFSRSSLSLTGGFGLHFPSFVSLYFDESDRSRTRGPTPWIRSFFINNAFDTSVYNILFYRGVFWLVQVWGCFPNFFRGDLWCPSLITGVFRPTADRYSFITYFCITGF